MTDKQKLQQLFDAALKSSTELDGGQPRRAFPAPIFEAVTVPEAPAPAPRLETAVPCQPVAMLTSAAESVTAIESGPPTMAAVLDDAASTELAAILDEQLARKSRRRKIEAMATAAVFLGMVTGGSAWFVQSPQRVQAIKEAMHDIRSVGDVKSMVAKYQAALDRISARGQQIGLATAAMGVKESAADQKDAFMEAEMKELSGGEGKTVGERNRVLQKTFGDTAQRAGVEAKASVALKESESFEWNR